MPGRSSQKTTHFGGMAIPGGDLVNASMDEEMAYQLTKAHVDNVDAIASMAPFMSTLNYGVLDPKSLVYGPNPSEVPPWCGACLGGSWLPVPECAKP